MKIYFDKKLIEFINQNMLPTHFEELQNLQKMGFCVSQSFEVDGIDKVWQKAEEIESQKDSFNYFIDGMVVKIDDNELWENLGNIGKTPRGWCAIKFAAKEVVAKVMGIHWQVGRTGKVTPIVELEPIELMHTMITRATLHNYKRFLELELCVGDLVILRKAGDIIPEIVGKVPEIETNLGNLDNENLENKI